MIDQLTYLATWTSVSVGNFLDPASHFAKACEGGNFLGFPHWFKYLDGEGTGANCVPKLTGINDIWLVVLALIEILLRVVALAAVVYIVYGGINFMLARGNPERINQARNAVQDALVGLVIAIAAIAIVNFVGTRF